MGMRMPSLPSPALSSPLVVEPGYRRTVVGLRCDDMSGDAAEMDVMDAILSTLCPVGVAR